MKIIIDCNENEMPVIGNYADLIAAKVSPAFVAGALNIVLWQVEVMEKNKFMGALREIEKEDGE
jgi:hypothetical protein